MTAAFLWTVAILANLCAMLLAAAVGHLTADKEMDDAELMRIMILAAAFLIVSYAAAAIAGAQ